MAKSNIHDFTSKLQQESVHKYFIDYINWVRSGCNTPFRAAPISINLDLTTRCNFRCPHCVDREIIQNGKEMSTEDIKLMGEALIKKGLKSVILIGGGEPTLHRGFGETVRYFKDKGIQLGVVSNGSRINEIYKVGQYFTRGDWVRFSLDAAKDETHRLNHGLSERSPVSLTKILSDSQGLKASFPDIKMGYSFVISWQDIHLGPNQHIPVNVYEISDAARRASEHKFDYLSLKPCLIKTDGTNVIETLFDPRIQNLDSARQVINEQIEKARAAGGIDIIPSINLRAILEGRAEELRKQPKLCHLGFFRQVISPLGIYHCPAFRGNTSACVGDYSLCAKQDDSYSGRTCETLLGFDAQRTCRDVACFYNKPNNFIDEFIKSGRDTADLNITQDTDFFL